MFCPFIKGSLPQVTLHGIFVQHVSVTSYFSRYVIRPPLLQYLGTIIFSMTRVASQVLGSFLLLKFKRRALFVSSAVITGLGMTLFAIATSDLLQPDDNHNDIMTLNGTIFLGKF